MSLVRNFFSSGTTNTQQNRNGFGIVDDGVSEDRRTLSDITLGAGKIKSKNMASKETEEEARPPYLHVRGPKICADLCYWLLY